MQIGYFTERPYKNVPEEVVIERGAFFGVSNSYFNPKTAAKLYDEYIEDFIRADDVGFDMLCLNEHHGTPFCMGGVMNLEASVMARVTSRAKICLIGNMLATRVPLRLAEELATIDVLSHGRLISGFVRGAGSEQFFNNMNPAINRELFEEAHDVILKAWTEDGPWRHEGKHYNYRHANPWIRPYQDPHPPIWIPGLLSPETIKWAAERSYVYCGLGTSIPMTIQMWEMYADAAAAIGLQAGTENFAYLAHVVAGDTSESAYEVSLGNSWGAASFAKPEFTLPPGYNSKSAIKRLAKAPTGSWLGVNREALVDSMSSSEVRTVDYEAARTRAAETHRKALEEERRIVGTPDEIIPKLKKLLDVLRPGALIFQNVQGDVPREGVRRSMELLGLEVAPVLREYADSIGIVDSTQRRPGSVPLASGVQRESVRDLSPVVAGSLHIDLPQDLQQPPAH
jgi:alkanesulfonate monooxygenase SsuD/methylene tetrahydromethanopterin reductase-like flavin-dependent oxidoreductase (luciferase family)